MNFAVQAVVIFICLFMISPQYTPARGEHEGASIIGVQSSHDLKQIKIKFSGKAARPIAYVVERPYRLIMDFQSIGLGNVPAKMTVNRGLIQEIRTGSNSSRARVVVDFGENPVPPFNVSTQNELVILTLNKTQQSAEKFKSAPEKSTAAPRIHSDRPSSAPAPLDRRSEHPDSRLSVKEAALNDDSIFVELADPKDPTRTYRIVMDLDHDSLQLRTAIFSDPFGNVKRFDMGPNPAVLEAPVLDSKRPPIQRKNWATAASGSDVKKTVKKSSSGSKYAKKPGQPTVIQRGPAVPKKSASGPKLAN